MGTETKGWLNVGPTKSQIAFDCLNPLRTSFSKVGANENRLVHIYRTVAYICKVGNKELVEKVIDIVGDLNKEIELLWHTESNLPICVKTIRRLAEHTEDMNKSLDTLIWEYLRRVQRTVLDIEPSYTQTREDDLKLIDSIDWSDVNFVEVAVSGDRVLKGTSYIYHELGYGYSKYRKSIYIDDYLNKSFVAKDIMREWDYREQDQKTCEHKWTKYIDADRNGKTEKCKFCNLICEHNFVERRRRITLGTMHWDECTKCGKN